MKKAILVNTYFQLVVAMQLTLTIFKNDEVVILISDHSNGAKIAAEKLKDMDLFGDVIFLQSKKVDTTHSVIKRLWYLFGPLFIHKKPRWISEELFDCDEFIYNSLCRSTDMVHLQLVRKNPKLRCHRIEEGILSYGRKSDEPTYDDLGLGGKIKYRLRQLLKIPICQESVENFYCFYPEFYNGNLKAVQIPKIQLNSEIGVLLCKIFDIKKETLVYDEKYIFFASVGDFEGGKKIGEVKTALALAEKVGKENVLVKVHPRDTTDNFAAAGLKVDTRSSVPWEAIQLNYDFADHVFLTSSSGSVLSVNMLLEPENRPETYFLYPMMDTDGNTCMTAAIETAERLFNSPAAENVLKRIHRATSLDEVI